MIVAMTHIAISILRLGLNASGVMVLVTPRTKNELNMFEPTTLPIARSGCFFIAATIAVTSSGRDVPIATIVRPMRDSERPNVCAMWIAPSTTQLLPNPSPRHPIATYIDALSMLCLLIPSVSSSPWTLAIPYV